MRVVVSEFVTLDGVADKPEVSMDFFTEDVGQFKTTEMDSAEALLLGRVTYEEFSAAWPGMEETEGEFAVRMNTMPKHVATRTLTDLQWNATPLAGEAHEAVAKLKAQPGGDLLVGGSIDFTQTLIDQGLVDEYRLLVFPVVAGDGRRLFGDGRSAKLKLVEATPFESGAVGLVYAPA